VAITCERTNYEIAGQARDEFVPNATVREGRS
jgi:hypothetical protein